MTEIFEKKTDKPYESFITALPVMAGYFMVSFVFGIMCIDAGMPLWFPAAMCLFVYAGASQFAALALISSGGAFITIILSTFLINSRHILMSMYMSSRKNIAKMSALKKTLYGFGLTDESFAIHSQRFESEKETSPKYLISFNFLCHFSWVLGSIIGAIASSYVSKLVSFKLDYALVAMMIFVLISICTTKKKIVVAIIAAFLTIALNAIYTSPLNFLIATIAACGVGICLKTRI
jgi:4-azaleucine resistance transporter AzlC